MVRGRSVAVMVNGDATTDAEGNPTYEPRSVEEMEKITALVRSAVGYDDSRGDTIEVVEMPFVAPLTADAEAQGLLLGLNKTDPYRPPILWWWAGLRFRRGRESPILDSNH